MPLEPPRAFETQRDRDQWARTVAVKPDDGTVGTDKIVDNAVTGPKLRNSVAASVMGRPEASAGDPEDIVSTVANTFIVRRATTLLWDLLDDTDIPATIARLTDVTAAIDALLALSDPFAQYYNQTRGDARYAQYATGTYTGAFTGCTTDPAPVLRYSIAGKVVVLVVPQTSATSNSTAFAITGAPAAIKPTRAQTLLAIVRDSGTVSVGTAQMGTNGTLTLALGAASGAFTNTGTKGVEALSLTYSLD